MKIDTSKYNRRLVIPDIHGCNKTLEALVKKVDLQPQDALFFLGDYIDRGPNSAGVIDFIIYLKEKNFNVFTLRGNHEQDFLEISENYSPEFFHHYAKTILRSSNLLKKKGKIKKRYRHFFENTKLYFELEDYLLVHAGFNFKKENFLDDITSLLNRRGWKMDIDRTNGKKVVHGHQPTDRKVIIKAINKNKNRIPLDNGCVYNKPHKYYDFNTLGHLCCLDLDSMELTFQQNIDRI